MAFETTTVPCKPLPSAAAGSSMSASASAWANSAWVQVSAGLTPAIQVVSMVVHAAGGGAVGDEIEVDLGTGLAAAEVVVATVRFCKSSTAQYVPNFDLRPILDNIAASTRIAVRCRHRDASAQTIIVGWNYYEKPTGIAQVSAQPHKWLPSAANGVDLTGSGAVDSDGLSTGAYFELVSSLSAASVLCAFYAQVVATAVNTPHWIDFATGTAGNEVVKATVKVRGRTNVGYNVPYTLPAPLDLFAAGVRISARLRYRSTSATSLRTAIQIAEKAL